MRVVRDLSPLEACTATHHHPATKPTTPTPNKNTDLLVLTPADLAIVNTAYEQLAPGARMSWPALNLPEHKLPAAQSHVGRRRKEDGE